MLTCILLTGVMGIYYGSARETMERHSDQELRDAANLVLHRLNEDNASVDKEILDIGAHLFLQLVDSNGKVLIESESIRDHISPDFNATAPSGTILQARSFRRGTRIKLVWEVDRGGWFLLGRDMAEDDWLLARLRRTAWTLLTLVPLLALGLGYALARLSLKPLWALAAQTSNILPESLSTRFDAASFPLEMTPMVSSLNEVLERLGTAFSRLGELNGNLAHDLRTPIHSLRLECEGLLNRIDLSEEIQDRVGSMVETLDHLAAVIEQMLDLARLEDPSRVIQKTNLDARRLLESTCSPFGALAEDHQVALKLEAPEELVLLGDGTLLRRALHNLLANAVRHSHPGGIVTLRAWCEDRSVVLEVADEGEGIAASLLPRLGQRFMSADASRSLGGAGLGLAIVQEVVRLHNGQFQIESVEGQGTVARVTLPGT
jgi:two-component system heavy metal sensor histidine kinase CusS